MTAKKQSSVTIEDATEAIPRSTTNSNVEVTACFILHLSLAHNFRGRALNIYFTTAVNSLSEVRGLVEGLLEA
jgi:hypothetical protein